MANSRWEFQDPSQDKVQNQQTPLFGLRELTSFRLHAGSRWFILAGIAIANDSDVFSDAAELAGLEMLAAIGV